MTYADKILEVLDGEVSMTEADVAAVMDRIVCFSDGSRHLFLEAGA